MKNKLHVAFLGLVLAMIVCAIGGKVFVDKISDKVIEKLQKDYSPSPYGPGIDPDKLDVDKIKSYKK